MKKRTSTSTRQPELELNHLLETARARLARNPAIDAIVREIESEALSLVSSGELKEIGNAIFKRKLSLDEALLGLARRGDTVLERASNAHQQVNANEEKLDARMVEELERRLRKRPDAPPTRPAGKKDYIITGKVVHPKTKKPVPGVVVEAVEKDATRHERLLPVITDDEGRFEIVVSPADLRKRKEPEIILLVGGDRGSLVPFKDVVRPSHKTPKELTLSLPEESLSAAAVLALAPQRVDARRLEGVRRAQSFRKIQGPIVQQAVTQLRKELGTWIEKKSKSASDPADKAVVSERVKEKSEARVESEQSPVAPPTDVVSRVKKDHKAKGKAPKPRPGKPDD